MEVPQWRIERVPCNREFRKYKALSEAIYLGSMGNRNMSITEVDLARMQV